MENSSEVDHHIGLGNWHAFNLPLERVYDAASEWRRALQDVSRPWLCWHVNEAWTTVQTRLVKTAGWTPVIGFDPRSGPPEPKDGCVVIDFNRHFGFEIMYMHFPLEFAFLFAGRLAFWHSDLLCRIETMRWLADTFAALPDGHVAAVLDRGGRRDILRRKRHRYWELVGCTTKGASADQFRQGAGWWQRFDAHPNCPSASERRRRSTYYWDHGVGIMYWQKHCGGSVQTLPRERVEEGHCTSMNRKNYQRLAPISKKLLGREIDLNYSLNTVARHLGVDHLLGD